MHIPYWDLRCEKCSDWQKATYGCEKDSDIGGFWDINGEKLLRCPIKLVTPETSCFLSAYNFLQKGVLPYSQGYLKNSNRYVEAMQVIDVEVKKLEVKAMKQRE